MSNPLVTCIVTHHLDENAPYLKLCLDSILATKDVDFEVLCVADTKKHPTYQNDDRRLTTIWDRDLDHPLATASAKMNWAAKHAAGKYLWFISDDVMVGKHAMKSMAVVMGENKLICNPMSNSDAGSQFWGDVGFPVKHSIEGFKSGNPTQELDVVETFVTTRMPLLVRANGFVAFYCTMMSKAVWDEVGELDATMDYRHNDQDYCIRAAQLGIPSMINLGAFALHFGDKTIPKCVTKEQLDECSRVFQAKYHG